ncbi:histone-lysine N-methyltransferase EHMT1 isoform X3 [Hypomesus transpacificus]|uniref:histone-lysine N-methyltransferase EHMT1 isoform X3 n=1 Tax=Hypomesus transpacificus TaxID=137520 RepID=UPI001F0874C2|nr:histone-lysine N-methyltransferase EHMT1 isoform X3 [Hypomesus transpacificus]
MCACGERKEEERSVRDSRSLSLALSLSLLLSLCVCLNLSFSMEANRKQHTGVGKSVGRGGPAAEKMESTRGREEEEEEGERDKKAAARLASSPRPEAELNGTYDITKAGPRHHSPASYPSPSNSSQPIAENGLMDLEPPPHGSLTGSNGYVLSKQQEGALGLALGATPHRTSWSPSGTTTGVEHTDKSLPPSAAERGPSLGAGRVEPGMRTASEQGPTETENGTSPGHPPIAVHRARKTMSRPASNQTLKLLNRELKEPNSAKEESRVGPEVDKPPPPPPSQNQLPQSQNNLPSAPSSKPTAALAFRKKKRKMGTYSLIPKKKTKGLRQRTMLEMFTEIQQSAEAPQPKEETHLNGERMENTWEDEEWEEESEEEEDQEQAREGDVDAQDRRLTAGPTSQGELGEEQFSEDSAEEEGEDEGTESDLSSESSLKKKLKKKAKGDSAWLRPSRKRKKKLKTKTELRTYGLSQPQSQPQSGFSEEYSEVPLEYLNRPVQDKLLCSRSPGVSRAASDADPAQELPLCSCRMETPKCREILTLADRKCMATDRKCMATDSVDGLLSRCHGAVLKQQMMRPSNSVQLLVLCEDHRGGMVKHQCCPGCGFFCRAGTFMECQPDVSISHRFHLSCASVLKGQSFCPHCGDEASKAKEVTIAKADTTSTVAPPAPHGQATPGALEGRADTTTGGPSRVSVGAEHSGRADSSLSGPHGLPGGLLLDAFPPAGGSRAGALGLGAPKETLESILQALDTEKPKKLRFHPKQLYVSAKQGELQKVLLMLVDGIDPNFKMETQNKRTPLHVAAEAGHQEICHLLVQAGANLNICDEDQRTPLMEACENNHLETVSYLLKAGAGAAHKDVEGFTCLHLAAKIGHYNIVEHLLSTRLVDINCQDDGGWTAMIWATEYKHLDQVKLLLAKGADIYIRDKEENICLHWAAFSGSVEIAELLLEAHCDLHAVNIHGDSPLHIAARENRLECVMLFLGRGADVNLKNREGETPPDCCSHSSRVWLALQVNRREVEARSNTPGEERTLNRDIARGYERIPVPCVNSVDSEPCPDNYKYVPVSCVTSPMNIDKNITHLQYCVCKDDCSSSSCMCGQLSLRCWYDKVRLLV